MNKFKKEFLILFLLCLFWPFFLMAQSLREKVNSGNEHYHAEEYEQAINKYKDALLDDPLNDKILFNEADALYKMDKYDESIEGYQKILGSKDMTLAARAHFNIGNAHFKQDKLTESIEEYKRALELVPDDYDAKYNLELARAKLKEQAQKKQQDPQQNQQQQNQQQQKSEQQKQDQQNKEQQDQQKDKQQQEQENQEQQQQQAMAKKDQINKEEAERILNALRSDEQEAQKKKAPVRASGRARGKDW